MTDHKTLGRKGSNGQNASLRDGAAPAMRTLRPETDVPLGDLFERLTVADQLAAMRPTLLIFLGGTGVRLATYLKALLIARLGYPLPPKIRLLVFDTTREAFSIRAGENTVKLEEGSELFVLSDVPVGRIADHIDNQPEIRDRFGSVFGAGNLPARILREGTKSNRILGAVSLFWHFSTVFGELRRAVWHLAGRDATAASTEALLGLNVFIGAGLGGGTGSGMFLDLAYIVRALSDELGIQSEFCRLTGIGVLPQAYPGIPSRSLYPNTGAALRELDHAMVQGNFRSRYPGGRRVAVRQSPFDFFYVLDGINERGRTWAGLEEVTAAGAQAVFLQMVSQLGRSGDNAFDNLDEALAGRTEDGLGTFLGSIGQAHLEFPAPDVAELCARRLVVEMARQAWLADASPTAAGAEAEARLQALTLVHLSAALMRDPQSGGEMHLDVRPPAWLLEKRHNEVAAETGQYLRRFGHARLDEGMLGQMAANGEAIIRAEQVDWRGWADAVLFAPGVAVPHVLAVLRTARAELAARSDAGRRQLTEWEQRLERLEVAQNQAESTLAAAAGGLPIGRAGRVRAAVDAVFKAAQSLLDARRQHGLLRGQLAVWAGVDEELERLERLTAGLADHLETVARQQAAAASEQAQRLGANGVARISLADEAYVHKLFNRHRPAGLALMTMSAFDQSGAPVSPLALAALPAAELGRVLVGTVADIFDPIRRMTVDEVVIERAAEMTPRARCRQLFREATPSWSIDRTRLPNGGDGLVRLEILGVPDARATAFDEEPVLVSTHDPHRIQALVIVAGAPMSALQQHDRYQAELERVRAVQPIHVLPAFMADADRGRVSFALGSIFGLIEAQGRYFYYQPADRLREPLLLGNGLPNAVGALTGAPAGALVSEIMERVDGHIARIGLQEAIARLTAYVESPTNDRSSLGELSRDLKRLVRSYTEELVEIDDLGKHK